MKNILLALMFIGLVCNLSCNALTVTEEERIDLLQSAINSHSYSAYMGCFDNDCSYQDTYDSDDFTAEYPSTVFYSFSNIDTSSSPITCDTTVSGSITDSFTSYFTMVDRDGIYYILTWTDGTNTIFQNRSPKK